MSFDDARVLRPPDPGYPRLLSRIHDPPERLWVRGRLDDDPAVAIVGSRACSRYGREVATRLAADLATAGMVVVSGLAYGIDAAAHRGALEAGGRTVAVLPGGVDEPQPRRHRQLAEQIAAGGALVTEHPPGTEVGPWSFPARNRIIAGLSLAVVVVEAAERSGARITAGLAMEYDRDVLVVPGPVTSRVSAGCHALLRDGAHPCTGAADVLELIPVEIADALRARLRAAGGEGVELSADEKRVLEACRADPATDTGALLTRTGLPLPHVLRALTGLELYGLIRVSGDRVDLIEVNPIE